MLSNRKKVKSVFCVATTLVLLVILYLNDTNYIRKPKIYTIRSKSEKNYKQISGTSSQNTYVRPSSDTKHILLWTDSTKSPFLYLGKGNTVFKERKCKFTNCHVTSDRGYLSHYREFEAIAFNGPQLMDIKLDKPEIRSAHQKYIYANIEAAAYYPICDDDWNKFFNWTWTYKLNSDAVWGYILIRNSSNHIIGPSMHIDWIKEDDMAPIDDDVKSKLINKTKAAAWFVSNCRTAGNREKYVNFFQNFITAYNLNVDVYGECGEFQCPKNIMSRCLNELQRNYYFYFAFENAISEDYVTEKVLHALNHYTVPVVYGGADYSRFLPPGSYLDAIKLGPQLLARKIYEIIENPESYYKFFRWRKYYTYHYRHENPETDDYCRFCAMINDETLMNQSTVYDNFTTWWTPSLICQRNDSSELQTPYFIKLPHNY